MSCVRSARHSLCASRFVSTECLVLLSKDVAKLVVGFLHRQPIGRFATADEVAGILIHIASDESKFTTGTFQIVDGGWSL